MANEYSGKARIAIRNSIKHWKCIQKRISNTSHKQQELDKLVYNGVIGEDNCALCKYDKVHGVGTCDTCPLFLEGVDCLEYNSPYRMVVRSTSSAGIVRSVNNMVTTLESLLMIKKCVDKKQ